MKFDEIKKYDLLTKGDGLKMEVLLVVSDIKKGSHGHITTFGSVKEKDYYVLAFKTNLDKTKCIVFPVWKAMFKGWVRLNSPKFKQELIERYTVHKI